MSVTPPTFDRAAHVRLNGVQKSYDGVSLVVRDLHLDIRKGEFLSLLGPSGSGKTTTLMMLAGFESPTAGDILLDDVPITRLPPHRRNFGMVFQNYALFPHLSVAENIAYPLTVRRVGRDERETRVRQALDMVRMAGMGDRRPSQLSGGQQQRVALARALVFNPQLVLMDEPLGALDKQLREHMQIELKMLHRRLGLTFVYVTHDQSEALTMSDRVAVFHEGVIQQIDRVEQLYEEPVNRFVAGFVGDNTVLQGQCASLNGTHAGVSLPQGATLHGRAVGQLRQGDAVHCCIRPERITLAEPSQQSNTLDTTLNDVIYFGDHLQLLCASPQQGDITVKVGLHHATALQPGAPLRLHLPPQFLRLYAASSS